jgi:hypothetical protein
VTWNTSHLMINFHFWSRSYLISWFNKDWHLDMYDSSWLTWLLRLNIHLLFSITFCTSTLRLSFALLWYMVHRGQVLVNPFQLSLYLTHHFMSFIYAFLKIFFLWSSCFHMYLILRSSTWSILSWLWAMHKCWTRLIFIFYLFQWFSYLTWYRFFNMELFFGRLYMLIT